VQCNFDCIRLEFKQFADLAGAQVRPVSKRKELLVALGEALDRSLQINAVGCLRSKILRRNDAGELCLGRDPVRDVLAQAAPRDPNGPGRVAGSDPARA
jgi:hypothetical protein